jgi:hypothetical protein
MKPLNNAYEIIVQTHPKHRFYTLRFSGIGCPGTKGIQGETF